MNKYIPLLLMPLLLVSACENNSTKEAEKSNIETEIKRPKYTFSTDEMYQIESVPAYSGEHQAIYQHIDESIDDHIKELQRWLRQPSVSAQNIGVRDMAEMVRSDFETLGFAEANLVETKGHPGVWGYYDAGAEKTLLVYMMYDVQPVNEEDWLSPPFEANLIDHELGKVIMARGATNQKGPQRAFLNALSSIIAVEGKLPVNIMIAAEGEEELGSPNYGQIVDAYEERMKQASGVIFPMSSQNAEGKSSMILGVKGIIYFEIEAKGGEWGGPSVAEIHGSYKGIVDSPTLRLLQAISSMTSKDGNTILIPGYYDDIIPPSDEEQLLINRTVHERDDKTLQASTGVSRWIDDQTGREALVDLLYNPTLNVDGIWSGYTGVGTKTILPHIATAKMDSRLPLGQSPEKMFANIRNHLDKNGYNDIEIRPFSGYPAAQTSVNAELSQKIISVYNKYTQGLSVNPRIAGSAPFYQFTERLKLPMVPMGLGLGRGAHAPNEIFLIHPAENVKAAGLADIEKAYVDLIYSLAH